MLDDYDSDDLITFKLSSNLTKIYYSQLVKYSKLIRDEYYFSDAVERLPQELSRIEEEYQINPENITYFFELLNQNYNISEQANLTYTQCIDLLKISKYFNVRKLSKMINEYIKTHNIDVDFIIQMIQYESQTRKTGANEEIETGIGKDMEELLSEKIEECLSNKKFNELPTSIVYRIVSKSSANGQMSDSLFDFIKKSVEKYCVLFPFIELQQLSENRLDELFELYSNSGKDKEACFSYLECNLSMMKNMKTANKKLEALCEDANRLNLVQQSQMSELQDTIKQLRKQLSAVEESKNQIETEKIQISKLLKDSEEKKRQVESEKSQIERQLKDSEEKKSKVESEKSQIEKQLKDSEEKKSKVESEKSQIERQLKDSEKEKGELQQRLEEELLPFKGTVVASVKQGLLISAQIKLIELKGELDTERSKLIVSTSGAKKLGPEAYEKGDPITSLEMSTNDFLCKSGTYYVRCLVVNKEGRSAELISNVVTTSGKSVTFEYEGKSSHVSVLAGRYKLEVWGAKGGDAAGTRDGLSQPGRGGPGGYSSGTLRLKEKEAFHITVGGSGESASSIKGEVTHGGFPDGGGTETGFFGNCTSRPGTGGGSTSIRVGSDSDYSRVIVAGGGGGAGGNYYYTDSGGFGGGVVGGNCCYNNLLQSQGSGSQAGSTCGRGSGLNGDAGSFGLGASGKGSSGCDSGGGGGGGWYGGGGGGRGKPLCSGCSSGGGGSGWTFTELSFSNWKSGDLINASKFLLSGDYYLTSATSIGGNKEIPRPDGNGTEIGHSGHGCAKITPE